MTTYLFTCTRRAFAAFVLVLTLPHLAVADTQTMAESHILQAAMRSSPEFQAVVQNAAIEKADAQQVSRLQNPKLDLAAVRTSAPGDNSNSYDVEIEQPLKLSQLSGARTRLSDSLFERAEIRLQHGLIQAFWATKLLYAQTWQAQEQARLYADFEKQARKVATTINKAVKAGQTPISEGSLFEGDVAKFASDFERVKAQEAQLRLELERATGVALGDMTLEKPVLSPIDSDLATLEAQARQNASLVRLLETDLRAATYQQQVARTDGFSPEISPRLLYGRNSDQHENAYGIGISLTIPLWDSNQAERRKAEAAKDYAKRQLDTFETLPLANRLSRILEATQRLDRRIEALNGKALPNYRKGFTQAQRSFTAGQTNAATLWQIRERLFETEQEALNTTIDAIEARRILSLETGTMPQGVTFE